MFRKPGTGLQTRFMLTIMGLMLAFLFLMLAGTYLFEYARIKTQVQQQLLTHADAKLEQVELRLSYLREGIDTFASSSLAVNSLIDASGRSSYLPNAVNDLVRGKEISQVVVYDFTGRVLESSGARLPDWHDDAFVRRGITLQRSEVRFLPARGTFLIFAPISYYDTAQGGVAAEVDAGKLFEDVLGKDDHGYAFSVGEEWRVSRHVPTEGAFVATARANNGDILNLFNAALTAYLPNNIATRPIHATLRDMAGIGVLAVIVSLLVAMRVGQGLARPILTLIDRVRNNVHPTGPMGSDDELDLLAEAFDRNTQKLMDAKNQLEARVEERTTQLREHGEALARRGMELEKLNRELTLLDRMKDEFISTVSHELRTPLTSIHGTLGLIVNGVLEEDSEKQTEMLRIALLNSERLSKLIDDLLDFNKLAAGKLTLELSTVKVADLIEEVVVGAKGYADKYHVHVRHLDDSTRAMFVKVDPSRMRQVLDNLLSNAIKFSPKHEHVDVYAQSRDGVNRILVRDRGAGIPPGFREKIFAKFSQADASDTRRHSGTGLGLSISKQLMEAHGGNIGFEDAEGGGTIFWIELAAVSAEQARLAEIQ